jgi:hypothetical protein
VCGAVCGRTALFLLAFAATSTNKSQVESLPIPELLEAEKYQVETGVGNKKFILPVL